MASLQEARSTKSGKPTAVSSDDRAFRVWAMLGEMYGAAFVAKYGASPGPLWRSEIAKLSDAELEAGIARLMDAGGAFPPSLPEFRTACTEAPQSMDEAQVEELAYQLIPSFDRQTQDRRTLEILARKNLDRARALLAGEVAPKDSEGITLKRLGYAAGTSLVRQ